MKKNRTITMLTVALGTLLSSCVGADIIQRDDSSVNEEGDKVNFSAGGITRVSGTTWAAGDQIGVTMYNSTFSTVINGYSNYRYDAVASGAKPTFTQKSGEMFFPGSDDVSFTAYYPYNASYTTTVPISTSNDSQADILHAKTTGWNRTANGLNVSFAFEHKLAKIVVKLEEGVNYSSDITISGLFHIGGYTAGNLDLKTGIVTTTGSTGSSTFFKSTGNSNEYYALMVPQTISNGVIAVNTSVGNANISLNGKVFEAKEYTYTVTVNSKNITIDNSTLISDRTKESTSSSIDV